MWAVLGSLAFADEYTDKKIIKAVIQETKDIFEQEMFGHYDLLHLEVLKVEDLRELVGLGRDYGLVMTTLQFSSKRNATKNPFLNPDMFESGSPMCQGWLYLLCGVPLGHVFDGKLEVLLAVNLDGSWRAVSPHWRSRREYPLHGYLLLEGKTKEGYVLFPK